jgi:hypothetical protein
VKRSGSAGVFLILPLCGVLFLLNLLAGCSIAGNTTVPTSTDSLSFSIDSFPDGTVDVTLSVVNSVTLASLLNQTYSGQSTSISASCSFPAATVNATISVKFHLLASAALSHGTNTTAGTTLTDVSANFTYSFPLFVVDNPTNPTVIADVAAIPSTTTLTLATAFPAGTYYLFQTKQLGGLITLTAVGTNTYLVLCDDDSLGTVQQSFNNL